MNVIWRDPLLIRDHIRLRLWISISHSNQKLSISIINQESFTFLACCCLTPKEKDSLLSITRPSSVIITCRIWACYLKVPKSCKSIKLHNKLIRSRWETPLRRMEGKFSITCGEHIACECRTGNRLVLSIKASFIHRTDSSNIKTGN